MGTIKSRLLPLTLSNFLLTPMKQLRTKSLFVCFCTLVVPLTHAGMAPSNDFLLDDPVHEAISSVKNPTIKAQSAPAYPVSLTGPNRIAVTGKKITNAIYEASQLEVQTDAVTGQVFVFPKTKDAVALFLTTEDKETHALTLIPQSVRSQEIVLGNTKQKGQQSEIHAPRTFKETIVSAPDLDKKVTRLIRALARNELPDGFHATNRCGSFCLKSLTSESLIGKVLVHQNTSEQSITLEEKLFYQKGVLAVAIENVHLEPKAMTRVYVIEKAEDKGLVR